MYWAKTDSAQERIANIRQVRAFAKEDMECATFDVKVHDVLNLSNKETLARAIFYGVVGQSKCLWLRSELG